MSEKTEEKQRLQEKMAGMQTVEEEEMESGTFGTALLSLPIVVARANLLVAVGAGRHAQAFCAALLTEEHAWLLVRRRRASVRAARSALRRMQPPSPLTPHAFPRHYTPSIGPRRVPRLSRRRNQQKKQQEGCAYNRRASRRRSHFFAGG
eukprot:TRINITY_DN5355_c0_g1_i1.p3 TRINITY_DN5355_c0_g1~~TRINITY_DN5355_c0_g1_i1.p3  ORF type:complete len:150 (-),score=11.07 TRINITY_DN5355_c0_g1_i1:68-517(-)